MEGQYNIFMQNDIFDFKKIFARPSEKRGRVPWASLLCVYGYPGLPKATFTNSAILGMEGLVC